MGATPRQQPARSSPAQGRGQRVDLAKNGLPVATSLAVAGLLSPRLDQQKGAVSRPIEGSRVTAEGIQLQLNGAVRTPRVLEPSVHP